LTETIKKVHEEKNVQGWCGKNKSYEVKQSFVDLRPVKVQSTLSKILSVNNSKSLEEAQEFKFNRLDLSKILKGSQEMLSAAKVEPAQM